MPGYEWIIIWGRILGKCTIFRSTLLGDDDSTSLINKPLGNLRKKVFMHLSLYFAINKKFEEIWRKEMGDKTPVFCSIQGIDPLIFNTKIRIEKNNTTNCPVILSNALLIKRKGYEQIFNELAKLNFNFKYRIIGQYLPSKHHKSSSIEEKEMAELHALGKKLLGEKIEFINTVEDITPYLRSADVFVYGASKDGTPNAVLEAMAVGLPVLMFNPPLQDDLFLDQTTLLSFYNFDQLNKKLQNVIYDKEMAEKIGENAAQAILKNYTFEKVVTSLLNKLNCHNL
jgi:glycosyltransferase involved in cell wall biosynthesis